MDGRMCTLRRASIQRQDYQLRNVTIGICI